LSLSAASRRFLAPGGAYLVPGAAIAAGLLAVSLFTLPLKFTVAALGVAAAAGLVIATRRPRPILLGLTVGLLTLDVKSFPSGLLLYPTHLGGAIGLVVTAQFILLIPLAVLALLERAGRPSEIAGRLPAGAILIPMIPILAVIPSLIGSRELSLSAFELLRMVCFYLLYLYFALDFRPGDTVLIVAALMVGVLIELPFVALEMVMPSFHFAFISTELGIAPENIAGTAVKRATGTLVHANILGGYLSLLLPIALAFVLAEKTVRWLRVLAVAALLAGLPMLLLTFNRGSWIGVGVAVPLVVLLLGFQGHLTSSQTVSYMVLVAIALAVSLAVPSVWERFVASDPSNVDFRLNINNSAVMMWQAYPWTGAGLNTFGEAVQDFDYRGVSLYRWPVHNIYLLWLAETGIVGTVGMVVFLIWAAIRLLRAGTSEHPQASLLAIGFAGGMLAVYTGELAGFSTRMESVAQAFYILLGVAVALGRTVPSPVTIGRLGELRVT
jgi:O-antigen ligase